MKTSYLGLAVVLLGVLMLGLTTATWWEVAVASPSPEEFELPQRIRGLSGAELRPGSVPTSLIVMAAGTLLLLVSPVGRVAGRRGRTITIALATVTVFGAIVPVLTIPGESFGVVLLGGVDPDETVLPAMGLYGLALLGCLVLCGLAWRLRSPSAPAADVADSSYTVEAVQAETTADEEWDLADASPNSTSERDS
ncbi:hypothetical protein [Euzebya tangerina]|uniref:hypothetical protein n=1 Tax=Euzebya tangerina TaxID=591198 RepID=UPI0013C2B2B2|nr:hypothetical protein [Euzebya tangerina]